ncbi:MAG: hypothetical protein H8E37_11785 [Planctomycetes bacterium]|nr:hypothetical protein [Planctomycetota bacterium]
MFFGLIAWQFGEQFSRSSADALLDLGRGRLLFDQLVLWQLGGVCLFMPILTSGAIASEKERGTLSLLLITQLSPMLILLEKLGSRVFVMFTLLLLAVPITAYAYSMGGIEPAQIAGRCSVLISTTCYVEALPLLCSSCCNSAASSLLSACVFGLRLVGLPAGFVLPAISSSGRPGMWVTTVTTQTFFVVAFLSVAKVVLMSRSEQPPKNLGLEFLRWMDGFWNDLNTKFAGGRIVLQSRASLPANEPITWRESHKKSLGSFRYLVRVLLAVEVPTAAVVLLNLDILNRVISAPRGLLWTVWIIVCLLITTRVSSIIAGERGRQTLDVVLATPMSGREIVRQFDKGSTRLMLVLSVPLLTCYSVRWLLSGWDANHLVYILSSLACIAVYLPLCSWTAMLIGLTVRSQIRAMIVSTLTLGFWGLWPILLPESMRLREVVFLFVFAVFLAIVAVSCLLLLLRSRVESESAQLLAGLAVIGGLLTGAYSIGASMLTRVWSGFAIPSQFSLEILVSPATIVLWQEETAVPHELIAANFAWFGFLLFFIRGICLQQADRCLGRATSR